LNHEAFDDSVKDEPVVKAAPGKHPEVLGRNGRDIVKKPYLDRAEIGLDHRYIRARARARFPSARDEKDGAQQD
jgi:hypothetical protein